MDFTAEKEILKRIANASQEIMYPSVPKRKEVPLRKLLLTSRIWERAREEEERLTEIESRNGSVAGGGDDDWWLTSTDETLEALVSFVNESPSLLERDPESPSALLDLDYSQQMFLNTPSDDLESETWSWLDVGPESTTTPTATAAEDMPKVNATQNLLSHTLHLEELAEDESEEDSEEDNNVHNSYSLHTQQETEEWLIQPQEEDEQEEQQEHRIDYPSKGYPCRTMLLDHQTVQVGKKIIFINQDANAPMLPPPTSPIPTNTCKRKRDDVDDEGFVEAPPAKKLLQDTSKPKRDDVDNKVKKLLEQNNQSASTVLSNHHSSYPPTDNLPLLRV